MTQPRVLITGLTGYIASHACLELLGDGAMVVGLDNFANSSPVVLDRLAELAHETIPFVEGDVRDLETVLGILGDHRIDTVMHFAGHKSVSQSVGTPLDYYRNNVTGAVVLLQAMQQHDVQRLVFSSSAALYSPSPDGRLDEESAVAPASPYGRTKVLIEQLISDVGAAEPRFSAMVLRYFNPVGAHPSGRIGEDPVGVPQNLVPMVMQVATGRRDEVAIYGDDYDTVDGTGVRDYLHVVDLAQGHVAALGALCEHRGVTTLNLGTGRGSSVREVLVAAERAVGAPIPHVVAARRPGDLAAAVAVPDRARTLLGWQASRSLEDMCEDHWRWQSQNPEGYQTNR